jgi:hypothetical protein
MGLLGRARDSAASEPVIEKAGSPLESSGTLKEQISQFYRLNQNSNCIVFENSGGEGLCKKITEMLSNLGIVISLPRDRPLILLPQAIDRELIAHRLSKSLNVAPILSFEAKSPENILESLQSL